MEKVICQHKLDGLRVASNGDVFKDSTKFVNRDGTYFVEIESQSALNPNTKLVTTLFKSSNELSASLQYSELEKAYN